MKNKYSFCSVVEALQNITLDEEAGEVQFGYISQTTEEKYLRIFDETNSFVVGEISWDGKDEYDMYDAIKEMIRIYEENPKIDFSNLEKIQESPNIKAKPYKKFDL